MRLRGIRKASFMNDALVFLGLLFKGKQIIIGTNVIGALKKKQIKAVLLAKDISELSESEIMEEVSKQKLLFVKAYMKSEIGSSIGKDIITTVGFKNAKSYETFIRKVERT